MRSGERAHRAHRYHGQANTINAWTWLCHVAKVVVSTSQFGIAWAPHYHSFRRIRPILVQYQAKNPQSVPFSSIFLDRIERRVRRLLEFVAGFK